jgi:hypothetical protein
MRDNPFPTISGSKEIAASVAGGTSRLDQNNPSEKA